MAHIRKILVPVDFNVPSRAALQLASDVAGPLGASIDVLHVIDIPGGSGLASEGYVPVPADYRLAVEKSAHERLEDWLSTTALPAQMRHIVKGSPAEEIVKFASAHKTDLIVMGTHGRTGMTHAFIGSVAERVVRTAHCPVLTVRPPEGT